MTDLGRTPYERITTLMDRLRAECPWDSQQSFETIAPYTVEESYEVMDAIERNDMADLKNELGDLLFQVLFHSKLASEIESGGQAKTLDGVAMSLPALMRAEKLQKRAAKRGFDWPNTEGPVEKLREEIEEVSQAVASQDQVEIESEIGDLLFSVVNLARKLKVEPEAALRNANAKFTRRFNAVEEMADPNLEALSLDEMEALWQAAKQNGL